MLCGVGLSSSWAGAGAPSTRKPLRTSKRHHMQAPGPRGPVEPLSKPSGAHRPSYSYVTYLAHQHHFPAAHCPTPRPLTTHSPFVHPLVPSRLLPFCDYCAPPRPFPGGYVTYLVRSRPRGAPPSSSGGAAAGAGAGAAAGAGTGAAAASRNGVSGTNGEHAVRRRFREFVSLADLLKVGAGGSCAVCDNDLSTFRAG